MPGNPAPITVDPSGQFLGDDGAWSTFLINVGTPPQQLHVLAASQVSLAWVVSPDGCGTNDASNCTKARGGPFDDGKSTSWTNKDEFQLGVESNLGYGGNAVNGTFGFDTLGLPGAPGAAAVSVEHQVVASIITDAFYVGSLGLNAATINFTAPGDSAPSFLTSLKDQNLIPSRSFGYTAGASYRQGGVNGSLILGGYDSSRIVPNDVQFTFAQTQGRELMVSLQGINYADSKTHNPLLSQSIMTLLDSTVPYLWLPQNVCSAFEKAFGITWDPISNLYLVNDTHHETLVKTNASISFLVSNSQSGPTVNITMPYASFDLVATPPLVKNASRYFPLQRANDANSYTLGRAFFQEAYMVVDFDSSNFTLSQAVSSSNTPSQIVAIQSSNASTSASPNPSSPGNITKTTGNSTSHGIGAGAIAGIVVAIILVALGALLAFFLVRRRRNKKPERIDSPDEGQMTEKPMIVDEDDAKDPPEPMEGPSSKPKDDIAPTLNVVEVPRSPPFSEIGGDELFPPGSPNKPSELPGHYPTRTELSTPEPPTTVEIGSRHDLRSLRSELSTPDPMYNDPELPSGHNRQEMPSPNPSDAVGAASDSEDEKSPTLPLQRPLSDRFDSSGSESGFTHDGMRLFGHPSIDTGVAELSKKTKPARKDSSESGISSPPLSPVSPLQSPVRRPVPNQVNAIRPQHHRLNSNESDSISTRMQLNSESKTTTNTTTKESSSRHADLQSESQSDVLDAAAEEAYRLSDKAAGKQPAV